MQGKYIVGLLLWVAITTANTFTQLSDSLQPFHRQQGDIMNYWLTTNFYNPALSGSLKAYYSQVNYMYGRPGSPYYQHHGQVWFDLFFGKKQARHGLGYRGEVGHFGLSTYIQHRFDYSFQIINKSKFSLRAGAGIGFRITDYATTHFTFPDEIDDRFGFVYHSQEIPSYAPSGGLQIDQLRWVAGISSRIYNGYLNLFVLNDTRIQLPPTQSVNGFGINATYFIRTNPLLISPSLEVIYFGTQHYNLNAGLLLISNARITGGGGIYYNNHHLLSLSALFSWNDLMRWGIQVQIPCSNIIKTYPVATIQITAAFKMNNLHTNEN